jgi:hypothetical protein
MLIKLKGNVMAIQYQRAGVLATAGLITGAMATYLTINAAQEGRSGADLFQPHTNYQAYWIDVAGGIACGSMAAGLSAIKDWWNNRKTQQNATSAPLLDREMVAKAQNPETVAPWWKGEDRSAQVSLYESPLYPPRIPYIP